MRYDQQIFCRWLRARRLVWLCVACLVGVTATVTAATNSPAVPPLPGIVKRTVKPAGTSAAVAPVIVPVQRVNVRFAWDAANDLSVVGYRVCYGRSPGHANHTNSVMVNFALTATLPLEVGVTNYVTCVSFNSLGAESIPSNEVSVTPQLIYKTFLIGSTDLGTWTDLCEVQTTNAAQMLRLVRRPVNVASQ